jgi:hypothetical protein
MNKYFKKKKYSLYLYASRHSFGLAIRFDKYGFEVMLFNIYLGVEW